MFYSEGGPAGIFYDDVGYLRQVTRLAYSLQLQFTLVMTLFTTSTIQVYPLQCTLFKNMNIIIRSCRVKTSTPFPILLQPNVMDYLR